MKNKDLRYATAQDLAEDLRRLQKHGGFAEQHQAEPVSTSPTEQVITNEPPRPKKRQFYFWQSSEHRAESETETFANQPTVKTKTARRNYLFVPFALIILLVIGAAVWFGWQFYKTDDSRSLLQGCASAL